MYVCVVHHDSCTLLVVVAIWEGQASHTLLPGLQQVGSSFIVMGEGNSVIVQPRQTVRVDLQVGLLVVRKGHGEESLRVTHKLVHIPLTSHLRNKTKDIFDSHMNPRPYLKKCHLLYRLLNYRYNVLTLFDLDLIEAKNTDHK